MTPRARLDGSQIRDWDSFHDVSARQLGFPSFYGRNMNAWIDCLTYLDVGDGMSRFHLKPGEVLELEITDVDKMRIAAPEILEAVVEATLAINQRHAESGKPALLRLVVQRG